MRLSISHETAYHYDDEVRASIQYLRLTPHDSERQHVLSWHLDLPKPVRAQVDAFGNILHVLTLEGPHDHIVISARGQVDIDEQREAEHEDGSPLPYRRFTRLTEADDALISFARRHGAKGDRAGLIALMNALGDHILYSPGATEIDTTAAQAFAGAKGVCQDHAHTFIACARSLGVPARFAAGYLFTPGSEQLECHAWAEAWLEGAWYSFDVTHRLARPERHLKIAVGLDYLDACPVRGVRRGGGFAQMHAKVVVTPTVLDQ
ncbi:transglutaminase family protein [Pseudomonas typographi]|uniref:Transglutaminase family protein n=1 Tax=Pseudomonas typographi TaxID=2715964 RepID=A0ABR7YZY8_9PSED|nr:transglutaminase family protein [Pseudomonas typographi]MBD1550606.1 transglutaminase family protein [Pseudomonas typographi]MBD1586809.1 transglutaminase family protein [Pseudomonas typographi]MBD1598703.1 transglutaminase family protein [Pseudomonas typographi]